MEKSSPPALIPDGVVALVAHDSGGAEILSSWIVRYPREYQLVVEGPAKKVFQKKVGLRQEMDLADAITSADWVLTGSSWQSSLELSAIRLAKEKSKCVVTFMDHWVNYRSRLIRNGNLTLPDELWVGDSYAYEVVTNELPEAKTVKLVDNPFLEDAVKRLKQYSFSVNDKETKILYLCENISTHASLIKGLSLEWGYTEYDAVDYFIENVKHQRIDYLTIRPHPSDPPDKYAYLSLKHKNFSILIDNCMDLVEQIAHHDWIVGCNTTAMVLGLLVGKRTISCIPPGGRRCVLPHPGIEHWV